MDPALIDEAFVRRAAALQGIELTAEQLPGVIENLRRTAQLAAAVNEFPLDPAAGELGPVWRP
ncbi:MAG: DUF4089 domain-containing protein [Proteobacteria bacterium]|nr:DUF4089 domain-containing protein [Pseudomonadota bacterium]